MEHERWRPRGDSVQVGKDATVILDAIKGYNKVDSFSALP